MRQFFNSVDGWQAMQAAAVRVIACGLACGLLTGCTVSQGRTGMGTIPTSKPVNISSNPWFLAATTGAIKDLETALASGADVNARERDNRYTPLHTAAMADNDQAVKFLLQHGADPDIVDEDGRTALMMALYNGRSSTSLTLAQSRANLELRDRNRTTALMFAARRGQIDAVRAMIARGVSLDLQEKSRMTALMYAARDGQPAVVRVLKDAGASTSATDRKGRSATDLALIKGHAEIVRILSGS